MYCESRMALVVPKDALKVANDVEGEAGSKRSREWSLSGAEVTPLSSDIPFEKSNFLDLFL